MIFASKKERRKHLQFTASPSPVKCVIKVLVILYDRFPLTPETENVGLLSFIVPHQIIRKQQHLKTISLTKKLDSQARDRFSEIKLLSFLYTDLNFSN